MHLISVTVNYRLRYFLHPESKWICFFLIMI